MTGRATVIVAGAAVTVAVLALVARPLLPHPTARSSTPVSAVTTPAAPASVFPVAIAAATRTLACSPNRPSMRDTSCGVLLVSRSQATCPTETSCQVELVGAMRTRAVDIPIALTVTLTGGPGVAGGWRAVEVTS